MSVPSAQAVRDSSSDHSASSSQSQLSHHEQKKRRQVTVACNECRKRKVKCDGSRPSCSPCHSRDLACCYEADPDAPPIVALKRKFEQLQRQAQDSEDVLEMLRSRPEREAMAILQRIRSSDLSSALSMIRDGDLLIPHPRQSYLLANSDSISTSSYTSNGFAAASRASNLTLLPMESLISDPLTCFEGPRDQRAGNSRFYPKFHGTGLSNALRAPGASTHGLAASPGFNPGERAWSPQRGMMEMEREICDNRLKNVRASSWTSVIIDDIIFAKIISTYLIWDHPPWRLFDEDMFIDDLVEGRASHCSKLLVNAILAYGCQNYAAIEPAAQALGSFFFVEAKQLWHLEEGTESLACITASGLLHGLFSCQGKDKVGLTYLVQGVRMAKDMGLFRKKTAAEVYDMAQPQLRKGRAAVAWGLFSYDVSHSMYMHRESLLKTPPPVPVPEPQQSLSRSSMSSAAGQWHLTKTFKASCDLWVIVKDVLPLYYNGDEPEDVDTSSLLWKIRPIYDRLLEWANNIPEEWKSSQNAPPHIINLNMQYHCVVTELFRPFVGEMPQPPPSGLASFPLGPAIASLDQLRHLVHQYVTHYNGPPVSVTLLGSILCVIYAAIGRLDDRDWKFFFVICIRFLGELVEYFPVAKFILQGVHNSAERTHTIMPPEALSVFDYYNGIINRVRISEVESSYPVDLNLSRTDLEGARLSNLIKRTVAITLDDA